MSSPHQCQGLAVTHRGSDPDYFWPASPSRPGFALQSPPALADHRMPVFQPTKGVVMPIYTEFRRIRSLLGIPLGALLISCQPDPVEGQFHFISLQPGIDLDGDGVQGGLDCDDEDAAISPRMPEIPYDGLDQDCSGADLVDVDGDGATSELVGGPDCDDQDPSRAPTRVEIVNDGIDQDCSGADAVDADGDGFVAGQEDCDDSSPDTHVGALELIDLSDNDCDGQIDEVPYSGVYNLMQLPSILTSTTPGAQFGFNLSPGGSTSPPRLSWWVRRGVTKCCFSD